MTQIPEKYALLTVEGKEIKLPLVIGSEGEKGIDITGLRRDTSWPRGAHVISSGSRRDCPWGPT